MVFLSIRGESFHNSFILSLILKPEPMAETAKICFLLELKHGDLLLDYIFTSFLFFWGFPLLPKIDCPESQFVDQTGFKPENFLPPEYWDKRCAPPHWALSFYFNPFSQVESLAGWDFFLRLSVPLFHFFFLLYYWTQELVFIPLSAALVLPSLNILCFYLSNLFLFIINLHKIQHE